MNVLDWVRARVGKPWRHGGQFTAFEHYLCGRKTFAECAIEVIEALAEDLDNSKCAEGDAPLTSQRSYNSIVARYKAGEDPEALLRLVLELEPVGAPEVPKK